MKPSNALPNQNASLKSDDSRPGCSQNEQPGGENTLNDSTSLNKSTLLKRNATKQKRLVRQSRIGVQKSQAESVSRCKSCGEIWIIASRILTFWARPTFMEKVVKITDPSVQQAWREKVALCTISFLMCFFLGFFTFLFQSSSCPPPQGYYTDIQELERLSKILSNDNHKVLINGRTYRLDNWWSNHPDVGGNDFLTRISGKDISSLFVFDNPSCRELGYQTPQFCSISSLYPEFDDIPNHCHKLSETTKRALNKMKVENINFDWPDVDGHPTRSCFNNYVLDFNAYLKMNVPWLGEEADSIIKSILGKDSTDVFAKNNKIPLAKCLIEVYGVGTMLTQVILVLFTNSELNVQHS
jgi:chitin synthase